ncbi:Two-component hybrid sensor and regulator [Labilithrix luteola]|uniref:histidine kinase n=2 Tax=Labilithrix luteola TaxID=1391654 RepID=A0A0K1QC38_9BACT|nr:Two-component hybrid sensor and regulator [Labilithrix luteola]
MVAMPGPDFRLLFESSHGLALAVAPQAPFHVVAVTNAFADAIRMPRAAIVGRPLAEVRRELVDTEDSALFDSLDRAVASGESDAMGVVNHGRRHLRPINVPIVRDGTVAYLLHRFDDVTLVEDELRRTRAQLTDRKELEAFRDRAFEHVRGIVDIAEEAIVSIDEQSRIVLFNTSAERCFGYRAAEVVGGPVDILLPERYRQMHREQIAAFAAETTGLTVQKHSRTVLGLRKNGEEFPAEAAISRVTVDGHSLFNAVLRDVTEQQRLETEERFLVEAGATLLAEATGDETALAGLGRLIVERFADVFMVEFTSSEGPQSRLVVEAERQGTFGEHARRAQLKRSAEALMAKVRGDRQPVVVPDVTPGTQAPAPFLALPLLLHGELIGVMACIGRPGSRPYDERDVRLALRVADLAALAADNARLHQATRLAVLARDEIVGIVAHDLRSPLSTILLASRLLRRPGTEPERRSSRNVELIERSAARMNRLIEDLLDVVRVDSKSLTVKREKLATNELLREILDGHRTAATAAKLDLVLECATNLPPVCADRDRVLQIFDNLIANAMKFTRPGGRIVLGASPRESEVVFSVADTGMGITAESLPHVFDRFWQARREDRRGVGLGLPIVRGIVEAHGGRIWVESQAGTGTRFAFTLPRTPDA